MLYEVITGVDDELAITMNVTDANEIKDWSLDIVDRQGNAFTSFGGKGTPAEKIYWDGRITSYNVCYTKLLRFEPTTPRLQVTCSGQLS